MFETRDALLEKLLKAHRCSGGEIGAQIELHEQLGSTNDRAKQLAAQGAAHGYVVLAQSQSAGRGRFGRSFFSPEGSGVYLSVVLRPQMSADRAVRLTALAAVAVARAIERVSNVQAQIKWVNDVYINGKKVCGILCEAGLDFESAQLQYVVMGIGVNVAPIIFPEELQTIATSISNECGFAVGRSAFCAALLDELNALYPHLEDNGFMDEYRARSLVPGREVRVLRGDESFLATAVEIDNEGSLIVRTKDGTLQILHSGEVSLKL